MMDWNFAIRMENDGEAYYLGQAEKNKANPLSKVFLMLAEAEGKHAELLTAKAMGASVDLFAGTRLPAAKSVFAGLGDFRKVAYENPDQMDAFEFATEMERKSIALYQGMMAGATEKKDLELLGFLVGQEQQHFALFEDLTLLLRRPKEWVEAAEFGPREEY